jgi:hypothetical protein
MDWRQNEKGETIEPASSFAASIGQILITVDRHLVACLR